MTVTLSLPEPPDTPVKLQYATHDGTAQSGRDYQATLGQVTLDSANSQAVIEITALNPGVVSGDLYFRLYYTIEPNTKEHSLYVVLPRERTGAPGQPVEPGPNEPGPVEPVEPTEPEPTPITYSISYSATEGGRIQGDAAQNLNPNEPGLPVTAIADPGYRFISWSDGLTTATRTATDVNANLQVTAQFRRNELWLATGHNGNLSVNAGPTTATIDWPVEAGKTYNLIVTSDPETEIENYGAYEARMFANVTPPLKIDELSTDEPVYIALEEDGKLKAWSSFVPRVFGTSGVALSTGADGTPHILAGPNINGTIRAVLADGVGGWYIGGGFDSINNQPRLNLAHINAAGELTHWNPGTNGAVYALAIDQGVIYAGGGFSEASGDAREYLAAFDIQGQLLPWNPGTNGAVYTLKSNPGIIYAGGTFTVAGGEVRSRLSAFNAQGQLLPWNPAVNYNVSTLAIDQGTIYVGGEFSEAEGEARARLAAFDTQGKLLPWNPEVSSSSSSKNAHIYTLAIDQGVIYAGGYFSRSGGEERSHLASFDIQGKLLPWNPGASFSVNALTIDQGVIYAAASFWVNGETHAIAAFDTLGQVLHWNPGARGSILALAIDNGIIYAGGSSIMAGGETR